MTRSSANLPPHVDHDIAERERNFDWQKNTVYWLVFEPKPGVTVGNDARHELWRIHLPGNPEGVPGYLDAGIAAFQSNLRIKTWTEVAQRYFVEQDYAP